MYKKEVRPQRSALSLLLICRLTYILFAEDKERGRGEHEEDRAATAVDEEARGEEASAEELAAT